MARIPDTRQSLLQRIQDAGDTGAWSEFVLIYRPAVLRIALRRGLQPADAEDVTQQVFVAIARTMKDWRVDRRIGSFRAWMLTVTRNAILNSLTRHRPRQAKGGTDALIRLHSQVDDRTLDAEIETEYRRALFRRAAFDVQEEVQPESWACFWRTAVERQPIVSVAKSLNRSVGSVYAARSRIMRRIRTRIERIEVGEASDG